MEAKAVVPQIALYSGRGCCLRFIHEGGVHCPFPLYLISVGRKSRLALQQFRIRMCICVFSIVFYATCKKLPNCYYFVQTKLYCYSYHTPCAPSHTFSNTFFTLEIHLTPGVSCQTRFLTCLLFRTIKIASKLTNINLTRVCRRTRRFIFIFFALTLFPCRPSS